MKTVLQLVAVILLMDFPSTVVQAQSFEVLYADNFGSRPSAELVQGSDGDFYGTTTEGGASDLGTVFKISASGICSVLYSFNGRNGSRPYAGLVQGSDGDFYGTTLTGGVNDLGTVFKIAASGSHRVLHSFNGSHGRNPIASLIQGSDGDFYGTTRAGGSIGYGTAFKISVSGTHRVLHNFNGFNGRHPQTELVQGSDGGFYGTTFQGGPSDLGTVFKISAIGTHSVLHYFNGSKGSNPAAGLVQGSDGNFYGTTTVGGPSDLGTAFKISASGKHSVLHYFSGSKGSQPYAALVQGSDGDFYGTTTLGGGDGAGTVFKISASGEHSVLHIFEGRRGIQPHAKLVQGDDGDFYGTTYDGGAKYLGTVFKMSAGGIHSLLHSFSGRKDHPTPAGLVQGRDGDFYGTTPMGGTGNYGTVFKVSVSGTRSVLHNFNGSNGSVPNVLVQGSDGDFYGTTYLGGVNNDGTVFKISASGTHSVLHNFYYSIGSYPAAGLVQGSDGDFYGTTTVGGANGAGTVFKISADGMHSVLHNFNNLNGRTPTADLVQGNDGDFYGTTYRGGTTYGNGATGLGTVFKISASGEHSVLRNFTGSDGSFPRVGLVQGSDGNFYGITEEGGANDLGTVFKISSGGTHSVLHSFDGSNGSQRYAGLVQGSDGDFYGTAYEGGANDLGTVFKISASGAYSVLHCFDGKKAAYPTSAPVFGSDGELYGTANQMAVWRLSFSSHEIALSGNGQVITNEDALSDTANHTDFGSVLAGRGSLTRIFTIQNIGAAELSLTGTPRVAISGSVAFSVSAQPASANVAANNGSQTFEVTFTPPTPGPHSAVVSIASNDADENPFTFTVAGTGVVAGSLTLSSATYTASGGAVVEVTVQRSGGTAATSVTLSTRDGSVGKVPPFAPALAGTDYEALAVVVDFAEGETSKMVPVTLLARTGLLPNRRFQVNLSDPANGAMLGVNSSAEVRLLALDTIAPTLTVKLPTTLISQMAPILVQGTAGDTLGLDRVEIEHGGMTFTATLGAATKPTSVPWSFALTPVGDGSSRVVIRANDLSGNMTTVTRNIDFIRRYPVAVTRQVPAGLGSPDEAGTVVLTSRLGDYSGLLPLRGAFTQTGVVLPPAQVTLTAKAVAGYIFSHWEGLPAGYTTAGIVANFEMQQYDVSGITAVFVANPFLGRGTKPVFYGLFGPVGETSDSNTTHGSLIVTLTASSGSFTGKIFRGGLTTAFTGMVTGDGGVWFRTSNKSFRSFLDLPGGAQMTGLLEDWQFLVEITEGDNSLKGAALPAAYGKADPVPAALLNRARQGNYTLLLPPTVQVPERPVADYPQGTGFARLTLQSNGNLKLAGKLADGSTVSAATYLVAGDAAEVFVPLLTPGGKTFGGSLLGRLTFDPGHPGHDVSGGDWRWFRPLAETKSELPQAYRAGWPGGLALQALGAFYDSSQTVQTALNLANPGPEGNARLVFSQGKLDNEVEIAFNQSDNRSLKLDATDKSYRLVVNAKTGLFQGTFTPGWSSSKPPVFQGLLMGKGAHRGGWGFFLSNRAGDVDPESGAVTLGQDSN